MCHIFLVVTVKMVNIGIHLACGSYRKINTVSSLLLGHPVKRLMTRCEKNWRRASQWQWFFTNFQLWPLVPVMSNLWKNPFHGVPEKPLTSLKSSMRSVLLRLSWRDNRPSRLSLSSYGKPWRSENNRVKRCWTRSGIVLCLWQHGFHKLVSSTSEFRCGLTRDL